MNVNLRINYIQNTFEERDTIEQYLTVSREDKGLTTVRRFSGRDAANLYMYLTGSYQLNYLDAQELKEKINNYPEHAADNIKDLKQKTVGENEEFDDISHAEHYNSGYRFEPRKVISDWDLNFNLGNTVKYISRAGRKGDKLTDLKKAAQYLQWEIERLEND